MFFQHSYLFNQIMPSVLSCSVLSCHFAANYVMQWCSCRPATPRRTSQQRSGGLMLLLLDQQEPQVSSCLLHCCRSRVHLVLLLVQMLLLCQLVVLQCLQTLS